MFFIFFILISHSLAFFLYLSHAFCIFILFFTTKELFRFFPFIEYTFLACKQIVNSGINTLISISDGLSPSIFCRKMERTRPMRGATDGKVVCFPAESTFPLWCCHSSRVLFPKGTLTWRVNIYVSHQEKI